MRFKTRRHLHMMMVYLRVIDSKKFKEFVSHFHFQFFRAVTHGHIHLGCCWIFTSYLSIYYQTLFCIPFNPLLQIR